MVIVRVRVSCHSGVSELLSADRPVVADSADALIGYTRADDEARLLGDCLFTVAVRCLASETETRQSQQ